MHVVTHLLASWAVAQPTQRTRRDVALVSWTGVAPDLDGVGLLVDAGREALGLSETTFYYAFHHVYGHGLPAAFLVTGLVAVAAVHKARAAAAVPRVQSPPAGRHSRLAR